MSKRFWHERWKYLCSMLIILPGCVHDYRQKKGLFSAVEYMNDFLCGLPSIEKGERFYLPGAWCLFFVILFWMNGKNAKDFTTCMGLQRLIRTQELWLVWRKKWRECFLCTTIYFVAPYAVMGIFGIVIGQGNQLWKWICSKQYINQIVIPVLAAGGILVWQLVVTMISNAVCGIIFCMSLLTVSVYFSKPFLPGNYLMKLRVNEFLDVGVNVRVMLSGLALLFVLGIIVGRKKMEKMDYMTAKGDF